MNTKIFTPLSRCLYWSKELSFNNFVMQYENNKLTAI